MQQTLTVMHFASAALQVLGSSPSLLALANDSRAFCAALVSGDAAA